MSLDGGATWVTTFSYTGGAQTYTVPEPPHPISLDVVEGPYTGGTPVTITGTDLTDTSQVLFCGSPPPISSCRATRRSTWSRRPKALGHATCG